MERDPYRGYAGNLEQIIKNIHLYLKETIDPFRLMCQMVNPDRNFPQELISDIRKIYNEIQDQMTKTRQIERLLQGKYRKYYRRDAQRDKEILEFEFLAKSCYLKFEYTLKQMETMKKLREGVRPIRVYDQSKHFSWFRSKENEGMFFRNLQMLNHLDYEMPMDLEVKERREVMQSRPRSLSLFVFSGDAGSIDGLQSSMRLRKHDIAERYGRGELRGVLTHLRGISLPEVERMIRRFMERGDLPKLKCLLLSIQSQEDLKKGVLGSAEKTLQTMVEGEVKTLSI